MIIHQKPKEQYTPANVAADFQHWKYARHEDDFLYLRNPKYASIYVKLTGEIARAWLNAYHVSQQGAEAPGLAN